MGNDDKEIAQNQVNMDTAKSLGRIEGNIETIMNSQKAIFSLLNQHDNRITHTENYLTGIKIKIGMVSAVISIIFTVLAEWIWNKLTTKI